MKKSRFFFILAVMTVLLFISGGSTVFAAEQKYKFSVPEIT